MLIPETKTYFDISSYRLTNSRSLSLVLHTDSLVVTNHIDNTIIPVFKFGDKSSVKSYRPISLLKNFSKVLECLVHSKVIGHLSNHIQFSFQ